MIIVVEPGRCSIDFAHRVIPMSGEIDLQNFRLVANKVDGPEYRQFIQQALPDIKLLGTIPYSEIIRRRDRNGLSVLNSLNAELLADFNCNLEALKQPA